MRRFWDYYYRPVAACQAAKAITSCKKEDDDLFNDVYNIKYILLHIDIDRLKWK